MGVDKISIKNFTVFEDVEINFSSGINVFIGENGTGKTHLLKLLYAFCESDKSKKTIAHGNFQYILSDCMQGLNISTKWQFADFIKWYVGNNEYVYLKDDNLVLDFNEVGERLFSGIDDESKQTVYNSVLIPAKDMLTHSKGLLEMADDRRSSMPFDMTLLDIIKKAKQWKLDKTPEIAKGIIPRLENMMDGIVIIENDTFYIKKNNGEMINFAVEAEGVKKIGLLWQLLMNKNITKGSILLWDEPEANLNPKLIPDLVEMLLELSRNGVQIFIATHDYILAKYFDVRKKESDNIMFHSLYKTKDGVKVSNSQTFKDLKPNPIVESFDNLMSEIYSNLRGD